MCEQERCVEGGGPGVVAERREQRAAEWQGRTQDTRTATAQQLDAGGRSSQPVADGTTLPGPGAVAFNQEKVLVGAFFVIVKTDCETDGSYAAPLPIVTLFQTPECRSCGG